MIVGGSNMLQHIIRYEGEIHFVGRDGLPYVHSIVTQAPTILDAWPRILAEWTLCPYFKQCAEVTSIIIGKWENRKHENSLRTLASD